MKNSKYSYKDFLNNDSFVKWQILKTEELCRYWAVFEQEHPECKAALHEAIKKIKTVTFNNYTLSDEEYKILMERIRENTIYRKTKTSRLYYYAAACVLAVLIISSVFITYSPLEEQVDFIVGEAKSSEDIKLVNSEKSLSLSEDVEIKITEKGKISIVDKEGEKVVENINLPKKTLNKLSVPHGKRSTLVLADGTKVWLNSGTELEFPSIFDGKTRDIYVHGEIYIDVAANEKKPFHIHTSQCEIQVLGTKFNVSAYKDDLEESVVLTDGKVKVKTLNETVLEMVPNEMLVVSAGSLEKEMVDVALYTSWIDGILSFDKASLSDILNKVGRYYNISFEKNKETEFAQRTYSGKLILSDNFDDVMHSISKFSSTIYQRDGNIVQIKNK